MIPPSVALLSAGVCGRFHNWYRSVSVKNLLVILCVTILALQLAAQQPASASSQATPATASDLAGAPFRNPSLPIDERVSDLISRMTLEEKVSQMRDRAPAVPRLGIPQYDWWNEGLHGVAFAGYATNFPQVIGMAATWD